MKNTKKPNTTIYASQALSLRSDDASTSGISYSSVMKRSTVRSKITMLITPANQLRIRGHDDLSKIDVIKSSDLRLILLTLLSDSESPKELSMMESSQLNLIKKEWFNLYGKKLRAKCSDWLSSSQVDDDLVSHGYTHLSELNDDDFFYCLINKRPSHVVHWITLLIMSLVNIDMGVDSNIIATPPRTDRSKYTWDFMIQEQDIMQHELFMVFANKTNEVNRDVLTVICDFIASRASIQEKHDRMRYAFYYAVMHEFIASKYHYVGSSISAAIEKTKQLRKVKRLDDMRDQKRLENMDIISKLSSSMELHCEWINHIFSYCWKKTRCIKCLIVAELIGSNAIFGCAPSSTSKSTNNISIIRNVVPYLEYWANMCRSPKELHVFKETERGLEIHNKPDVVILSAISQFVFNGLTSDENPTVQGMKIIRDVDGQLALEYTEAHYAAMCDFVYSHAMKLSVMGASKIEIRVVIGSEIKTMHIMRLPKTTPQKLILNGPILIMKKLALAGPNQASVARPERMFGVEPFIITPAATAINKKEVLETVCKVLNADFAKRGWSNIFSFHVSVHATTIFMDVNPNATEGELKSNLMLWVKDSKEFLIRARDAIGNLLTEWNPGYKASVTLVFLLKAKTSFAFLTPIKLTIDTTKQPTSIVEKLNSCVIEEKTFTGSSESKRETNSLW